MARGIIYCLTNPEMPDLVKIGLVESVDVDALKSRMSRLYSTGVPVPFELHYAVTVDDVREAEKFMHDAFDNVRENPRREFFRIDPARIVSAMRLTRGEEVRVDDTPDGDSEISQVDIDARNRARQRENKKASNFKFSDTDIPVEEAELQFVQDSSITATIVGDKKIKFEDEEMSLSGAAKIILERKGRYGSVAGTKYWEYNGKTLYEWREQKAAEADSELDE